MNSEIVKDDGGAVGLTQNPSPLQHWVVAGPEVARIVGKFEKGLSHKKTQSTLYKQEISIHQERPLS